MAHIKSPLTAAVLGVALAVASVSASMAAAPKADTGKVTATLKALEVALKAGDKDKVVALFADDATIEDPAGSPWKAGKAASDKCYANAVDKKIWIELSNFDVQANGETNVDAAVHVGERTVQSKEIYAFKPDGKIASMKAFPPAKKE